MALEARDLGKHPGTLPFSKIGAVRTLNDEQALQFFNGLFQAAVEAKEDGNWTRVEQFLTSWEDQFTSRSRPDAIRFDVTPWTPFSKAISQATVALITTGGVYIEGQEVFNTDGDVSYRVLPKYTPRDRYRVAHTHYDTSGVTEDVNCVYPIDRLREMEAEGRIGKLVDDCYGFMGYIPGPLVDRLVQETVPDVARRLRAAGVEAALIGTT
jgi:D-proline reductase (dithiol) PrdB